LTPVIAEHNGDHRAANANPSDFARYEQSTDDYGLR